MRSFLFIALAIFSFTSCDTVKKVADTASTQTLATLNFNAFGSTPSWSASIEPKGNIQFSYEGNQNIVVVPTPVPFYSKDSIIYLHQSGDRNLRIAILQQPCSDKTTSQVHKYSANVKYNDMQFNGCAALAVNVNSLAGAWEFLSSPELTIGQKKPALNFDILKNNVGGNSGCNSMTGTFASEGNTIKFNNDFISTKMFCEGYDETKFFNLLFSVDNYAIKNNELHLNAGTKTVMVFKRK